MNRHSIIDKEANADDDAKTHYIHHLERSSAYYTAKKSARKAWINGDKNEIENARSKFSHYLFQIDYQTNHYSQGENMSMTGLHQSCTQILKQAISKAAANLNVLRQKRLDRICHELDMPVSRIRNLRDEELLLDDKDGLFSAITEIYPDLQLPFHGLPSQSGKRFERLCFFDDSDIFDGLQSISLSLQNSLQKITGFQSEGDGRNIWSAFSIPIRTVSLTELSGIFKELHPSQPQVGIDSDKIFYNEMDIRIEEILKTRSIKAAQQLAKEGVVSGSRAQIWDLILQTDFVEDFKEYRNTYCTKLTENIASTEFVYDRLLLIDVKHSQNDESYFVFEEILNKVILYWSRDTWYSNKINQTKTPDSVFLENKSIGFPLNGMYPIWGLSLYAMPICYIYDNSSCIYFTFRELYARFFTHLHSFSDRTDNILYLCIAFENLLKQSDSHLYFHLQFNLDLQPLSIAYRWILYGFVGVLSPDQVLLLWDRMIGYNTCLIFSVMAAAIFSFRKEELLSAKCEQDVFNHLNDLMNLETVPVLQEFIFTKFQV